MDPPQSDISFPFAHCPSFPLSSSMDCPPATCPYDRGLEMGQTLDRLPWTALTLLTWSRARSRFSPSSILLWLGCLATASDNKIIFPRSTSLRCGSRCPERPSSLLFPHGHKSSEGSISTFQQRRIPTCQQLMNCCRGWLMPCEISH